MKAALADKPKALARNTKQKEAIREAITVADRPVSPEEILSAAQQQVESVSLATVYRNLAVLVAEGWLKSVELPGMPARYERAGKNHHHHFHCNTCDKVFELDGCVADLKMKLPRGFRATAHEIFLSGNCGDCR